MDVCGHVCPSALLVKKNLDQQFFQTAFEPAQPIDPVEFPLRITLRGAGGIVYQASLPRGALVPRWNRGNSWTYRSRTAKTAGGIGKLELRWGSGNGNASVMRLYSKSFGELLVEPSTNMTFEIEVGGQTFRSTATWSEIKSGWIIPRLA